MVFDWKGLVELAGTLGTQAATSARLGSLRQWRNDADYLHELAWDDMQATADAALLQAQEVLIILNAPTARSGS
jgi:hypothetical protein